MAPDWGCRGGRLWVDRQVGRGKSCFFDVLKGDCGVARGLHSVLVSAQIRGGLIRRKHT